jgi:hypothetical protein
VMNFSVSKVQASAIKNKKSAARNTHFVIFNRTDDNAYIRI